MARKPKLLRWVRDDTLPTLTSVTFSSDNTDTTIAAIGDIVTLAFTASEDINLIATTISGKNVEPTKTGLLTYSVAYTMVEGDTTGEVAIAIDFKDLTGNDGVKVIATTGGEIVTCDCTRPTATLLYSIDGGSTYASDITVKDADTLRVKATFSEIIADSPVPKLAIDNAVLVATNMTKTSTTVYYYDLNVPVGDIDATCTVTLAEDAIGNLITTDAPTNSTFTIDNTAPTLDSAAYTDATTLTITMDEFMDATSVTNANDGGFVVAETGDAGTTYAVSAVAAGTTADLVVLTVADVTASATPGLTVTYATGGNATATDAAGNALATDAIGVVIATYA